MRRITILTAVLPFFLFAGCNKEEERIDDFVKSTFQATAENPVTKTLLGDGDSETLPHAILWTPGDAIGITSGSVLGKYVYEGTENVETADFEGEAIDGDLFYAVFPYSGSASVSGEVLSFELPSVQKYVPLSFGVSDFPMVAKSNDRILEFKNLCGLLKIDLVGDAVISSIVFTASDADGKPVNVAGKANVNMDYGNVPELVMSEDAVTSVTLDCGNGVALSISEATPFYIALPPGTYDEFKVKFIASDGKTMTKLSHDLVINRSMVRPAADLEFVPDETLDDREALIAFYNATDGPNWINSTDWCTDEPIDAWYGITTNSEGRVTGIDLPDNKLSGDAGSTLAALTELQYINFQNTYSSNNADYNQLTSLDVTQNIKLTHLYCGYNRLSSLDVSGNTMLTYLSCGWNELSSLDISDTKDLVYLWCAGNEMSSLDVSENTVLAELLCAGNELISLDVSRNIELTYLSCERNSISSLDVSKNTKLEYLYCAENNLSSLDVSSNSALVHLYCRSNNISLLDVSNNAALTLLYCDSNVIPSLDLSENRALTNLTCYSNRITSLDIRNNSCLGDDFGVGLQKDLSGEYCDMILYVTESQLAQWNSTWAGDDRNVYVKVSTRENWFEISPATFDVSAAGEEIKVNISTDQDYTVNIANPDWISLVSGEGVKEGEIVFKVEENTAAERTGVIQFCTGANCYKVEVRQKAGTQGVDEELFNKTFYHRSLAMRFTADWCGYCPNMAEGFHMAQEQAPDKIESVSYHGSGSGLAFPFTSVLTGQYSVSGLPTGIVDGRTLIQNYDKSVIASRVVEAMYETEENYPTASGISFNSSISGQTLSADVTLYLKKAGDYKVTVVVLEDGIVGYQANYYTGTTYDYVHDGVARIALSDISGDTFSTDSDNVTRTFSYNAVIPSEYNKNNLRILVYVHRAYGSQPVISSGDYGEYYIDNCASGKAGASLELITVEDMDNVGGGNEDFGNDGRHEW